MRVPLCLIGCVLCLTLCIVHWQQADAVPADPSDKKIAFLFMSRGAMPLEEIWHEFFRWHTNNTHYNIYCHVHKGYSFPVSSFFHGKELSNEGREPLGEKGHLWGNMAQVRAIRSLVRSALKDPLNAWFLLMSESCIPLFNFNRMRNTLLHHSKSIINACPDMGIKEMEGDTRWRPGLDEVGFKLSHWRKSATWFALKREHAQVFADDESTDRGWEKVPCVDEHFLPSLLAKHGLDNETSCTDGFTHVHWASPNDAHPHTYGADAITPELFQHLATDIGSGFAATLGLSTCSGIAGMCHIMARKFSSAAKYSLLENIDLILTDDEDQYEGNPWDHHQDKFRRNVTSHGDEYYLIENGFLRHIPDDETLAALHHLRIDDEKGTDLHTQALAEIDLVAYPMKAAIPSRRDGILIKAPKNNQVYVLEKGKRRAIPNMDTLMHLKLRLSDVKVLSDEDVQQILLGDPIPDINNHNSASGGKPERHHRHKKNAESGSGGHMLGEHGRAIHKHKERPGSKSHVPAPVAGKLLDTNGTAPMKKWLYESDTTDTDGHLGEVDVDEGYSASYKTLSKKATTSVV